MKRIFKTSVLILVVLISIINLKLVNAENLNNNNYPLDFSKIDYIFDHDNNIIVLDSSNKVITNDFYARYQNAYQNDEYLYLIDEIASKGYAFLSQKNDQPLRDTSIHVEYYTIRSATKSTQNSLGGTTTLTFYF